MQIIKKHNQNNAVIGIKIHNLFQTPNSRVSCCNGFFLLPPVLLLSPTLLTSPFTVKPTKALALRRYLSALEVEVRDGLLYIWAKNI